MPQPEPEITENDFVVEFADTIKVICKPLVPSPDWRILHCSGGSVVDQEVISPGHPALIVDASLRAERTA